MTNTWCWLTNSMERVYKGTLPRSTKSLRIDLGKGDKESFQASIRMSCENQKEIDAILEAPDVIKTRIRRVGHVPMMHFNINTTKDEKDGLGHIPGFVPDPLFDDTKIGIFVEDETETYWINVETSEDTPEGIYPVSVTFKSGENIIETLTAQVHVHPLVVKPRTNFPVMHWFYTDALCDWYKVNPFDEGFWKIVKPYMVNLKDHGNDVLHSPIFTPPTDGVKRPTQLLKVKKVSDDKYSFDWSDVKRWIDTAHECGLEYFEWSHLFFQGGFNIAINIYENYDSVYADDRLLWPMGTSGTDPVYYNFLSQFLPEFKSFLDKEELLDKSFFHLSDEPFSEIAKENYRKARNLIRELAPWMKVLDALKEPSFVQEGLVDMPVSAICHSMKFKELGYPHFDYFSCGHRGRYLNRLMDTPLAKIRGAGWLFYRFGTCGFLHWGYNFWYNKMHNTKLIDPYKVTDADFWPWIPYGDPFVVYPGKNGPTDSIRWEVFSQSLADYALLKSSGIDPEDNALNAIKSYEDFPKNADWYRLMRLYLLSI